MNTDKKVLNVLGIIMAWILSIALILTLFVSPMLLSALSTVKPDKIFDSVRDLEISQVLEMMDDGVDADSESFQDLLATDTVLELFDIYLDDLANGFENPSAQKLLTEEKIKEVVHKNIDEFYEVAKQESADLALLPEAEAKEQVEKMVVESLVELLPALPTAEMLKQEIITSTPELEMLFTVFTMVNTIKLTLIGAIVVISALIYGCRFVGFRGLRWIAVDLIVASALSGLICAAISFVGTILVEMLADVAFANTLVQEFMSDFANGVNVRTVIMLACGIGMLVLYLFLKKKFVQKNLSAAPTAVSAESEKPAEIVENC